MIMKCVPMSVLLLLAATTASIGQATSMFVNISAVNSVLSIIPPIQEFRRSDGSVEILINISPFVGPGNGESITLTPKEPNLRIALLTIRPAIRTNQVQDSVVELNLTDASTGSNSFAQIDRIVVESATLVRPGQRSVQMSGRMGLLNIRGNLGNTSAASPPNGIFAAQIFDISALGDIRGSIEASGHPSINPVVAGTVRSVESRDGRVEGRIRARSQTIQLIRGARGLGSPTLPLEIDAPLDTSLISAGTPSIRANAWVN